MSTPDMSNDIIDLKHILHELSKYCDALRAKVRAVEDEVGANLSPEAWAGTETIKQVQNLDYVQQALEDLSTLAASLSRVESIGTLPATTANAIRGILGLRDTQNLLGDVPDSELAENDRASAGHLHLF